MVLLLVVGLASMGGALLLGTTWRTVTRRRRRRRWEAADAVVMAVGAGGWSLYEVYRAARDHEQVLEALQRVYGNALPADPSAMDWATYFDLQVRAGPDSVRGVISGWAGSLGEDEAVEMLNHSGLLSEHGITAHRFDAPNHPGTDVYFRGADGHVLSPDELSELGLSEIQVKSYADVGAFLEEVRSNPDVPYVVNEEIFDALEDRGLLDDGHLQELGTAVTDGGWSHAALRAKAEAVVEEMHEGLDVAEDVPFVAIGLFGFKAVQNVRRVAQGEQSLSEAGVNVAGDGVRMAVGGVAAGGGAKVGAIVGTALAPGLGTLAGGVIGALGGGLWAGRKIHGWKDGVKYGALREACERIGGRYAADLREEGTPAREAIAREVLHVDLRELEAGYEAERALAHDRGLSASGRPSVRPTPADVLLTRGLLDTRHQLRVAKASLEGVVRRLRALGSSTGRSGAVAYGVLGSVVAMDAERLVGGDPRYTEDVRLVQQKVARFPNHPYRLWDASGARLDEVARVDAIATESRREAKRLPSEGPWWRRPTPTYGWGGGIGGGLLVLAWWVWMWGG